RENSFKMQAMVLERMGDGVSVSNTDGIILYTNTSEDRMFGYEPGELLGKHISILNFATSEENFIKINVVMHELQTKGSWNGEWENIKKDGTRFTSYCNITALKLEDETVYVCLQRDITQEKKNTEQLIYQSKLNKTITENATSALLMMNKYGYCTFLNPAAEKLFGFTVDEISSKPLHYMIHHHRPDGSEYPMEECPIDRALPENFDIKAHEDVFFRKDGSKIYVSCSASPIFEKGVPIATLVEVRDVTEEKQFKETILANNKELTRINNDLDNFIYTASHDLKAPISNIEGLVNSLNDVISEDFQSEDFNQILAMINSSIKKFQHTIQDLTDISKAQKSSEESNDIVDVGEIIKEVLENLRKEIKESKAEIRLDLKAGLCVHFSRKNFRSVIFNLISNAIKYRCPERKPEVSISMSSNKEYQILKVQDNGLGITPENKHKVFEMFKRLHAHVDGSGVGLYIVRRIVDNAGGRIELDSEPGKGSAFRVYFKNTVMEKQ
ncbi:MAG: PAS domain S-box protein, partial [Cytophagaceae bacterium]